MSGFDQLLGGFSFALSWKGLTYLLPRLPVEGGRIVSISPRAGATRRNDTAFSPHVWA